MYEITLEDGTWAEAEDEAGAVMAAETMLREAGKRQGVVIAEAVVEIVLIGWWKPFSCTA